MKQKKTAFQDEILISMSDLWMICKRAKKKIALAAVLGIILGFLYAIRVPVHYSATATFKDSSGSAKNIESKLELLVGASQDNSNTLGTMLSRRIMIPVVKDLGLQASLVEVGQGGFFNTVLQNIKIFYAYYQYTFRLRPAGGIVSGRVIIPAGPVIPDSSLGICCTDVAYPGEYFIPFNVDFIDEEHYHLTGPKGQAIGVFRLGEKVGTEQYSFKMIRTSSDMLASRQFILSLIPISAAANSLVNDVKIKKDKENKNLLRLTYINADRHLAAAIVNQVMLHYKNYLRDEHQRMVRAQLDYLESRQNETSHQLEHMMELHAQYLKEHLGHGGFIALKKEIDFVAGNQARFKARLLDIDLGLKLIDNVERNEYLFFDNVNGSGTHELYQEFLDLQHQREVLSLALKRSSTESLDQKQGALFNQIHRLKEIEEDLKDVEILLSSLQSGERFPDQLKITSRPHSLINAWIGMVQASEEELKQSNTLADASIKSDTLNKRKEWFGAFLRNLQKQHSVQAGMIREHMAMQEGEEVNFQGIDLDTAHKLYLTYTSKQDEIQAKIRELDYLKKQLENSEFEISSLSTVLEDKVSEGIIEEASVLLRQLKDEKNRSHREQERIRADLNLARSFLILHVQQSKEIFGLRENLLKEKIYSLQKVTLDLIHQKLAILDHQLDQHIHLRSKSFENERDLVQKELIDLNQNMSHLPEKWFAEERIELRKAMSLKIVEELASLVEAKNIAHDMEQIECTPLDMAVASTLPVSPRLLLFAFIGAFGGIFVYVGWLFSSTLLKGVRASQGNLELFGQHVSGRLYGTGVLKIACSTREEQQSFTTIRKIILFLTTPSMVVNQGVGPSKVVVIFRGDGPDYSDVLCHFLSKRGDRVLKIDGNFETSPLDESPQHLPGLLQYLERQAEAPQVNREPGYDSVHSGGKSVYSLELLNSKMFQGYLGRLKGQYDWVVLITPYRADNHEALGILAFADRALITLSEERVQELTPLYDAIGNEGHKLSFLLWSRENP